MWAFVWYNHAMPWTEILFYARTAAELLLAGALVVWLLRRHFDSKRSVDFVFLRVKVPKKDNKEDLDRERDLTGNIASVVGVSEQFFTSMHGIYSSDMSRYLTSQDYMTCEVIAENGQIFFYFGIPRRLSRVLEKQISSYYPDCVIDFVPAPKLFSDGMVQSTAMFAAKKPFWYPFKSYVDFKSTDPMSNLLNVLSDSSDEDGMSAGVQFLLRPVPDGWQAEAKRKAKQLTKTKSGGGGLLKLFRMLLNGTENEDMSQNGQEVQSEENHDLEKLLNQKVEQFGFEVIIRAVTSASSTHQADMNMRSIENAFAAYGVASLNYIKRKKYHFKTQLLNNFIWRRFRRSWPFSPKMLLTPAEISAMWHLPHAKYNTTPGIAWQNYKIVRAPSNVPKKGLLMGHNVFRGVTTPVYMKPDDRMRHFYVIGQTGTGKTTILLNMIRQDLQNGHGFCVIDPHGQLVEDILPHVPRHRADDIIVFDPSDLERPMGLNLLEAHTPEEAEMVALDAMNMMIKMFNEETFGPRIQDYFRNGVLTLMADPNGSALTDIVRLFTDDDFQRMKVRHVVNPIVKSFWTNQMAKTGAREKAEMIPYFAAKFSGFISNGMMRNIIGQTKSAFEFGTAMDTNKVLLMNLSKGTTGELNSKLLGLMIVQKIQMAALRRQSQAKADRVDFFLYIDEFQNYVTDSIESILSEARKYRLGLNIAHQYIAQIDQGGAKGGVNLKDAVFGNVGTMVSYKISAQDAEVLAKEMMPAFNDSDLVNMDKYKAVMKLSIDTQPSKPFSLVPENPYIIPVDKEIGAAVKQISRLTHARSKKFVEKEIFARLNV